MVLLSYIVISLYIFSVLFAAAAGQGTAAGAAVMTGAEEAVQLTLRLTGAVCLWSAVMEVLERCGGAALLSRALAPLLGRLFPRAAVDEETMAALSENVSANLLGLGNAATPAGIRAAKGLRRLNDGDGLGLLVVLNTASIQLLPTMAASLRAAYGAAAPFDITPAVWISSVCSVAAGLVAAALLRRVWR